MASLTLYGSNVADATLTNACKVSNITGGSETTVAITFTGSNSFGELRSQGGADASVAAIPGTPTGRGYVYSPGAGSFATGNWSAIYAVKDAGGPYSPTGLVFVASRYRSGAYTEIGRITLSTPTVNATRTVLTFAATSMGTITFIAGDLLYWSYWWNDSGISSDTPVNHASNSGTSGVANDVQVTTSSFTAASASHSIICDGTGGTFK